jgi:uncharacterized protein YndB with AHSA1/START domain
MGLFGQMYYRSEMDVDVSMWGAYGPRPEPDHDLDELFGSMSATAEIVIACTVAQAWALIASVERIGEFSPECVEAWWMPDHPSRVAGGRFEGRNRMVGPAGVREWIRPCDVLVWEPGRRFAWTVGDRYDGTPSSRWTFSITPIPGGVHLRQEFHHVPDGLSGLRHWAEADLSRAASLVAQRAADLEKAMAATLQRMKAVLEREKAPPST